MVWHVDSTFFVVYGVYTEIVVFRTPGVRTGYASIIIMLFLGGSIIMISGMLGEYLARIYMEVKQRPIYFVRETNVQNEDKSHI